MTIPIINPFDSSHIQKDNQEDHPSDIHIEKETRDGKEEEGKRKWRWELIRKIIIERKDGLTKICQEKKTAGKDIKEILKRRFEWFAKCCDDNGTN